MELCCSARPGSAAAPVCTQPPCPLRPQQVGFVAGAEQFFFYMAMNLLCHWFYTVFGSFVVYITPNQQLGQVRSGHSCGGRNNAHAPLQSRDVPQLRAHVHA